MSGPSRLLIVGAGGRTGRLLCELAARKGHIVTTLGRRPMPVGAEAAAHRQITGDARDAAVVREALKDQDVVITAVAAQSRGPNTMVSDITRTVLSEMDKARVNRIVVTSSRNVTATKPWLAVAPTKWFFRHIYADLVRTEHLVRDSGLDWTIVRAVMLTDQPPSGVVHIDQNANATGGDWRLPRADFARVLLDTALDPATVHQHLGVNGLKEPALP